MMSETKYPGADTSKERLEEILNIYQYSFPRAVRDLLAMIEERDAFIAKVLAEETQRMNIGPIEGGVEVDD